MISALGFIGSPATERALDRFVPDRQVEEALAYLRIPVVETGSADDGETGDASDDEFDPIGPDDRIIWSTPNNEEITGLSFHVYGSGPIFTHHDTFVFSTIMDGATLPGGRVALGTFEPYIFIYDAFVSFPVLPQALLTGHSGPVTGVVYEEAGQGQPTGRLLSSGEDRLVIEWDMEKMVSRARVDYEFPVECFDASGGWIVCGNGTYMRLSSEESVSLADPLERVRMDGARGRVYGLDCAGMMSVYDVREMRSPLVRKRVHEGSALDVVVCGDEVATCGMDGTVKVWSGENYEEKAVFKKEGVVCRLAYDGTGRLFCGGQDDVVSELVLGE